MCLAIPGKIESIEDSLDDIFRTAKVSFGEIRRTVNISMVPEANVGDYVLIHVGVAISMIDEEEAHKTLQYLQEANELMDELGEETS